MSASIFELRSDLEQAALEIESDLESTVPQGGGNVGPSVQSCPARAQRATIHCLSPQTCPAIPNLQCAREIAGIPIEFVMIEAPRRDPTTGLRILTRRRSETWKFVPEVRDAWERFAANMRRFGMPFEAFLSGGSHLCRCKNVGRPTNDLSPHAFGDAVDLVGVRWMVGSPPSVLRETIVHNFEDPGQRTLLRRINACLRLSFSTVLDYHNRLHRDHFHCDMNRGRGRCISPAGCATTWSFVQEALGALLGQDISITGTLNAITKAALQTFARRGAELFAAQNRGILNQVLDQLFTVTAAGGAAVPVAPPPPVPPTPPAPRQAPPAPMRPGVPGAQFPPGAIRRVWVFADVLPTRLQTFSNQIQSLGVTDVVLPLNDLADVRARQDRPFRMAAIPSRLQPIVSALRTLGVDIHVMTWMQPFSGYMLGAAAALRPLCAAIRPRSLVIDAEEPWFKHPRIFRQGEAVTRDLLARFWQFDQWPCTLGLTSYPSVAKLMRPLVERCDYVLPQAYSTTEHGIQDVYIPGNTQRFSDRLWRPLGKPIVMGLGAYSLRIPAGLDEGGAMQVAAAASEELNFTEIAYWSLRHLTKVGSADRAAFVSRASGKARAGIPQRTPGQLIGPTPAPPPAQPRPAPPPSGQPGVPPLVGREDIPAATTLYVNIPLGGEKPAPPMTGIFVPQGYQWRGRIDLILFLHGFHIGLPSRSVAQFWKARHTQFREPLNASNRNAILVAPTLGPRSEGALLSQPAGFDTYVDRVIGALNSHFPFPRPFIGPPLPGTIVVASHSGGGKPMQSIAAKSQRYASNLREIWGFDCLYNRGHDHFWADWAARRPDAAVHIYYIPGTQTAPLSESLRRIAQQRALANVNVHASLRTVHDTVPITHWAERIKSSGLAPRS